MTKRAAEPNAEYCALCNAPATAAWHGDHVVAVCSDCAISTLPALIADAVELRRGNQWDSVKLRWLQAEKAYWRAMTARMIRENT